MLALVFVYLIQKHKCLKEIAASIMAAWKLTKYSSVKAAVFGTAQSAEGEKNLKLLKAAPTTEWRSIKASCISHGITH